MNVIKLKDGNLTVPTKIDGIDSKILNPIETWKDQSAYEAAKIDLIAQFEKTSKDLVFDKK